MSKTTDQVRVKAALATQIVGTDPILTRVAYDSFVLDACREADPLFDEKCTYHQELMDQFLGGQIPMRLADTKEGQAKLDIINAKVSNAMIERFGE